GVTWVVVVFLQAEDGIRDWSVTGVQTCALPISGLPAGRRLGYGMVTLVRPWLSEPGEEAHAGPVGAFDAADGQACAMAAVRWAQIGRASCRERGEGGVGAVWL